MLWTTTAMGGRSSLPIPGERSDSDFSGPPSLLCLPGLELGAAKGYSPQISINSDPLVSFLSSNSYTQLQVNANTHSNHFLNIFPYFLNEIPEYIQLNELFLE